jgi:hypothetical protein
MWAASGAVKLNHAAGRLAGSAQTGSVLGVAVFGWLLPGTGVRGAYEEKIQDGR